MTRKTSDSQWRGHDEASIARRGFLKGPAAIVGAGIGTFGMVRDDRVFGFKGRPAAAAEGDDEPTLVPSQYPYCGVRVHFCPSAPTALSLTAL